MYSWDGGYIYLPVTSGHHNTTYESPGQVMSAYDTDPLPNYVLLSVDFLSLLDV